MLPEPSDVVENILLCDLIEINLKAGFLELSNGPRISVHRGSGFAERALILDELLGPCRDRHAVISGGRGYIDATGHAFKFDFFGPEHLHGFREIHASGLHHLFANLRAGGLLGVSEIVMRCVLRFHRRGRLALPFGNDSLEDVVAFPLTDSGHQSYLSHRRPFLSMLHSRVEWEGRGNSTTVTTFRHTSCKPFILKGVITCNTYKKQGGGSSLLLTRNFPGRTGGCCCY